MGLAQNFRDERGDEIPDAALGTMRLVRRWLFRGEALTKRDVDERIPGASHNLLGQVVAQLETLGYTIRRTDEVWTDDEGIEHTIERRRVTNPSYFPTTEAFASYREARTERARFRRRANHRAVVPAEPEPTPPATQHDTELPPLPALGQNVSIVALALNDDGSVTMGLRNGQRRWLTTVTGSFEQ